MAKPESAGQPSAEATRAAVAALPADASNGASDAASAAMSEGGDDVRRAFLALIVLLTNVFSGTLVLKLSGQLRGGEMMGDVEGADGSVLIMARWRAPDFRTSLRKLLRGAAASTSAKLPQKPETLKIL
jgi:hypothetical protein